MKIAKLFVFGIMLLFLAHSSYANDYWVKIIPDDGNTVCPGQTKRFVIKTNIRETAWLLIATEQNNIIRFNGQSSERIELKARIGNLNGQSFYIDYRAGFEIDILDEHHLFVTDIVSIALLGSDGKPRLFGIRDFYTSGGGYQLPVHIGPPSDFTTITGDDYLENCNGEPNIYNLSNRHTYVTGVNWSTSTWLDIEGQSNHYQVSINKNDDQHSGLETISAEVQYELSGVNCGSKILTKKVYVGKFDPPVINGDRYVCPNQWYEYEVDVTGGHLPDYSYEWTAPYGWQVYSQTDNRIVFITPFTIYSGTIGVKLITPCGTNVGYGGISINAGSNCGGYYFMSSPNPVSSELTIKGSTHPSGRVESLSEIVSFEAVLYDSNQIIRKRDKSKDGIVKFNVNNLKKGTYFLHIKNRNKTEKKQIIIN